MAPTPHYYGPGKSVAVIGASRGIGAELVKQLLARGCDRVYATERVVGKSKALSSMLASGGEGGDGKKRLVVSACDVGDPGSISAWVEALAKERSKEKKKHLDLVIHNAGIAEWSSLSSVTSEVMGKLFSVNAVGPLLVAQQLDKRGLLGKGTTLANMTSKMGSMAGRLFVGWFLPFLCFILCFLNDRRENFGLAFFSHKKTQKNKN